jgi:hypothetical protein
MITENYRQALEKEKQSYRGVNKQNEYEEKYTKKLIIESFITKSIAYY